MGEGVLRSQVFNRRTGKSRLLICICIYETCSLKLLCINSYFLTKINKQINFKIYIYTHIHKRIPMYCMYVCMSVCVYVSKYIYIYVYGTVKTHISHLYTHTAHLSEKNISIYPSIHHYESNYLWSKEV